MPIYEFHINATDTKALDQFMQGAESLLKQQWQDSRLEKRAEDGLS